MSYLFILILAVGLIATIFLYIQEKNKFKKYEIVNREYIEKHNGLSKLNSDLKQAEQKIDSIYKKEKEIINKALQKKQSIEKEINNKKTEINDLNNFSEQLKKQVDLYSETFDYFEYGIYEPIFKYNDSEKYKTEIRKHIEEQKLLLKDNKAVINKSIKHPTETKSDFNKRVSAINKNILTSFNLECENISNGLTRNSYNKMLERFSKTYETINKNNSINEIHYANISQRYFYAKKNEIISKFKYEETKIRIKEEQEAIKAQMREEERENKILEREKQKALKLAQKAQEDEDKFNLELRKAENELKSLLKEEFDQKIKNDNHKNEILKIEMERKISLLQLELEEAIKVKSRNLSMAQQTKRGHVYIISNIGSFGEGIYKIGMTRRLEPLDRIKELSNASVPFEFDVHGIIYSEDAPALEKRLHHHFLNNRVNLVNLRKEFFKVSLLEIEKYLETNNIENSLTITSLAKDYYETVSINKMALLRNIPVSQLIKNVESTAIESFQDDDIEKDIEISYKKEPIEVIETRRKSIFE